MTVYCRTLRSGITRSREFEKKRLAQFAVNCGLKCGQACLYCSTGAVMRTHRVFREIGESPFDFGYAIVDPSTPERVSRDARSRRERGLVQLCSFVDAWAPEAKRHDLGRRCLEAILREPDWSVRVLTKNVSVREDFDLLARYRDRVLVGLSITAAEDKAELMRLIEPGAPPIQDRMRVMREAADLGLRTYAMLCPLLPGIADGPEQIDELIQSAVNCGVEEIFVEPVNSRGPGLRLCQEALEKAGHHKEAAAIRAIRSRHCWSRYVVRLIKNVQRSMRALSDIHKLRFLLYPSNLLPGDAMEIKSDDAGVVWLGKGGQLATG